MFKRYKNRLILAISTLFLLIPLAVHGYIVQRGDTLSRLAYKFGTTVANLVKINNIKNPNLIFTGQHLNISGDGILGANPLPEDNYDTYLTSPVSAADATIFVNRIPTGVTESIYTIFATDGRTVREKIYCTGATSTPNRLTGCVRGLSFYPTASGTITETAGTGLSHSKNARIAITDNINFSGKALSYLYGNQALPGNLLFNNGAIIGLATPTSSATSSAANVNYVNNVAFAGAPDSSQTIKGISEIATDNELSIGKADGTGNTTAPLVAHASSFNTTSTAGNKVPVSRLSDGKLDASWGGATSSIATLDSNVLVVQDPANAQVNPGVNKIPKGDASSTVDAWVSKKFGGDGSDGALDISSGTTTINLGGAAVFTKNYSSISITGTGHLAFTNPNTYGTLIVLKSKTTSTITCTVAPCIDVSGMGAAGGAYASKGASGSNGQTPNLVFDSANHGGGGGANCAGGGGGGGISAAGTGGSICGGGTGAAGSVYNPNSFYMQIGLKMFFITPGAGGGGGGQTDNGGTNYTGHNGGNGGGALILESQGALEFTGTIWAKGNNGSSPSGGTVNNTGGGGGGAGGNIALFYNTLTANTGTITVTGGSGGTKANSGTDGGAGANGNSTVSKNTEWY